MHRVFNFNAGPAMLPEEVLLQAQKEMLDWHGTGMSIMEIGHRGALFKDIAEQAETDVRELMNIPNNYQVLFLSGGARAQFAMVPLNLYGTKLHADYADTGVWSRIAMTEAKRYGTVNIVTKTKEKDGLITIPAQDQWQFSDNAAYVHYTPNETIDGVEFNWIPETGDVPLVADMTSNILSRPIDVSKFGIIYASAQKNMGQAGITVVIIRDDLIQEPLPKTPTLYIYKTHAEHHSLYNTPPTYSWYISGLVFAWMKRHGGVEHFYKVNQRKASKLYHFIDQHQDFYFNRIHPDCRSTMNVVFTLRDEALTHLFLEKSNNAGLTNLKGHSLAGGLRASLYNGMPEEGVDRLIEFMDDFMQNAY